MGNWSGILVDPLNDLAIDGGIYSVSDCAFSMLMEARMCCMDRRTVMNDMAVCMMLMAVWSFLI